MALSSTLTAALPAFTKALAPVRVNLIAAGFVDTPLSASLLGDNLETLDDRPKGLAILERIGTVYDGRKFMDGNLVKKADKAKEVAA